MKMQFNEDEYQVMLVMGKNVEEAILSFLEKAVEEKGFLVRRFTSKESVVHFFLRVIDKRKFAEEAIHHPIWKEKSFHQELREANKPKEDDETKVSARSQFRKKTSIIAKKMREAQMRRVDPEVQKYEQFEWLNLNSEFITSSYEFVVRHLTQEEQLRVIYGMLSKIKVGDEILFEQLVYSEKKRKKLNFTSASSMLFTLQALKILKSGIPLNSSTRPTLKTSSIENLKKYYGEVGAHYFLFADKYIRFLVVPALWGLVCTLANAYKLLSPYHLNLLDFSFAAMMVIWAAVFTGDWKRFSKVQCFEWGTRSDISSMSEKNPEYYGPIRVSPVSGLPETHYPSSLRKKQYMRTACWLFCLSLVSFTITLVNLNLRDQIHKHSRFVYSEWLSSLAQPGAIFDKLTWRRHLVSVFEVVVILQFLGYANDICETTTKAENHKTLDRKRTSLGLKRFMFFMMSGVFYYIFLTLFGGSFQEVKSTLYSVITISSCVRLISECALPYLKTRIQQKEQTKLEKAFEGNEKNEDYFQMKTGEANLEKYDVFNEYFSMMEQYSYLMLFAPNFQIGPLIALVFNFFERKTDLIKVLYANRRPWPMKLPGSKVWEIFQNPWNIVSIYAISVQLAFDDSKLRAILTILGFRKHFDLQENEEGSSNEFFAFIVMIHLFLLAYIWIQGALSKEPKWIRLFNKRKLHRKVMGNFGN